MRRLLHLRDEGVPALCGGVLGPIGLGLARRREVAVLEEHLCPERAALLAVEINSLEALYVLQGTDMEERILGLPGGPRVVAPGVQRRLRQTPRLAFLTLEARNLLSHAELPIIGEIVADLSFLLDVYVRRA